MQDYYNSLLPKITHYHQVQSELTENRIIPFMEDHIDYREADFLTSTIHTDNPEFFDWNKKTAVKLYNMMAMLKSQNGDLKKLYIEANGNAITVMQLLKKEYHLSESTPLEK